MKKLVSSVLTLLLLISNSYAGQTYTISQNTTANICLGDGSCEFVVNQGTDPNDNTLTVNAGATVTGSVHVADVGGSTSASGNKADIHGAITYEVIGAKVGGSGNVSGDATDNHVTVYAGGSAGGIQDNRGNYKSVMGGVIQYESPDGGETGPINVTVSGSAEENSVSIAAGLSNYIAGGGVGTYFYVQDGSTGGGTITIIGDADGNTVNFTGGENQGQIIGGAIFAEGYDNNIDITINGDVQNNVVNISGGAVNADWDANGGLFAGGAIILNETAGNTEINGNVSDNEVNIGGSASIRDQNIYGGIIRGAGNSGVINGTANDNKVNISGGTLQNGDIFGGLINDRDISVSASAAADNNEVNIGGGTITADIIVGGQIKNGISGSQSNGNIVKITGGNTTVNGAIAGAINTYGNAENNTVIIGKDAVLNTSDAILMGGWTGATGGTPHGSVSGNTLNLAGAGRTFYGVQGFEEYNFDLNGVAANSTMLTALHGTGNGRSTLNNLEEKGDNEAIDIDGATIGLKKADGTNARPDLLGLGEKITLIDATGNNLGFSGNLANSQKTLTEEYATYTYSWIIANNKLDLYYDNYVYDDGGGNTASTNILNGDTTVTVTGSPIVDSVAATGNNTVNITGSGNVTFNNMHIGDGATLTVNAPSAHYAFDSLHIKGENATFAQELHAGNTNLNFYIPEATVNGSQMLNVNGIADIEGATVKVGFNSNGTALHIGDNITLLHADEITGTPANMDDNARMNDGLTLNYNVKLSFSPTLAGGIMVGAGVGGGPSLITDLFAIITGAGLDSKTKVLSEGRIAGLAFARQGGDLAAQDGIISAVSSAQDTKGYAAFTAGSLGKSKYETGSYAEVKGTSFMAGLAKELNDSTFGVFFEYGGGSYDTNNSFASGDIKGNGNASYTGGGLLGHFALENNNYVEASARLGQVKTDFNSKDYVDASGLNAKYDLDTMYYGAHIGGGHIFELDEKISINGYGKYLWTHENGKEVSLPTSEKVDFAAADSHRIRAGLKVDYNRKGVLSPYAGAAYEQELAGKADAKISGLDVDAPSLKGGTAIGELGLKVSHNYLSADLGAQGYGGKRKGVSGSLKLNYKF
ncbi:MAG: autotransporter outer membrane beta-barrel domain-containing protein [Elusimicrobiota bacterium]|jgi:hypothetical protein|nr:autotransporter outer membrane beta-barrel domain-containing protein [Elusimicrobiota bacterium]